MNRVLVRLLAFVLPLLAGALLATAQVAAAFQYHPALGTPLLILHGWRWYPPWAIAGWLVSYGRQHAEVFRLPMLLMLGSALVAVVVLLLVTLWQARTREDARLVTHGSARWGTEADMKRSGLLR